MSPTIAARSKWARIEALQRKRDFLREYAAALASLLARIVGVLFPPGTWAMRIGHQPVGDSRSSKGDLLETDTSVFSMVVIQTSLYSMDGVRAYDNEAARRVDTPTAAPTDSETPDDSTIRLRAPGKDR